METGKSDNLTLGDLCMFGLLNMTPIIGYNLLFNWYLFYEPNL